MRRKTIQLGKQQNRSREYRPHRCGNVRSRQTRATHIFCAVVQRWQKYEPIVSEISMPIRDHHFRELFVLHRQRDARVQRVRGGEPVSSVKEGQRHFCAELPHGSVPRDHPVSQRSIRSVVRPEAELSNRRALPWNQYVTQEAGRCRRRPRGRRSIWRKIPAGKCSFWGPSVSEAGSFREITSPENRLI